MGSQSPSRSLLSKSKSNLMFKQVASTKSSQKIIFHLYSGKLRMKRTHNIYTNIYNICLQQRKTCLEQETGDIYILWSSKSSVTCCIFERSFYWNDCASVICQASFGNVKGTWLYRPSATAPLALTQSVVRKSLFFFQYLQSSLTYF